MTLNWRYIHNKFLHKLGQSDPRQSYEMFLFFYNVNDIGTGCSFMCFQSNLIQRHQQSIWQEIRPYKKILFFLSLP